MRSELFLGLCPKGYDPLVTFTDFRSIKIETKAYGGYLAGYFKLTFNGETFAFPALATDWTETDCQQSFMSLRNVGTVQCTQGDSDPYGSTTYLIQFKEWPVIPYENNIYVNDGNPLNSAFSCDVTAVTGGTLPSCTIVDVAVDSVAGDYNFKFAVIFYVWRIYFSAVVFVIYRIHQLLQQRCM